MSCHGLYDKYQQQDTSHSLPAIMYFLLSFNFYLLIFLKCVTVEEQVTEAELLNVIPARPRDC